MSATSRNERRNEVAGNNGDEKPAVLTSSSSDDGNNSSGDSDGADAKPMSIDTRAQQRKMVSYRDYSRIPPEKKTGPSAIISQGVAAKEPTFPVKLHMILSNPAFELIIQWLPHGRSWRILQQKPFEERVIPYYFRHGRYSSFTRQVNGWGFKRIVSGSDFNSYYHELFLRGLPHLCEKMRRLTSKDTANKKKDEDEPAPDFYSLSRDHPLPESTPSPLPTCDSLSSPAVAAAASGSNVGTAKLKNIELAALDKRRAEILEQMDRIQAGRPEIASAVSQPAGNPCGGPSYLNWQNLLALQQKEQEPQAERPPTSVPHTDASNLASLVATLNRGRAMSSLAHPQDASAEFAQSPSASAPAPSTLNALLPTQSSMGTLNTALSDLQALLLQAGLQSIHQQQMMQRQQQAQQPQQTQPLSQQQVTPQVQGSPSAQQQHQPQQAPDAGLLLQLIQSAAIGSASMAPPVPLQASQGVLAQLLFDILRGGGGSNGSTPTPFIPTSTPGQTSVVPSSNASEQSTIQTIPPAPSFNIAQILAASILHPSHQLSSSGNPDNSSTTATPTCAPQISSSLPRQDDTGTGGASASGVTHINSATAPGALNLVQLLNSTGFQNIQGRVGGSFFPSSSSGSGPVQTNNAAAPVPTPVPSSQSVNLSQFFGTGRNVDGASVGLSSVLSSHTSQLDTAPSSAPPSHTGFNLVQLLGNVDLQSLQRQLAGARPGANDLAALLALSSGIGKSVQNQNQEERGDQ